MKRCQLPSVSHKSRQKQVCQTVGQPPVVKTRQIMMMMTPVQEYNWNEKKILFVMKRRLMYLSSVVLHCHSGGQATQRPTFFAPHSRWRHHSYFSGCAIMMNYDASLASLSTSITIRGKWRWSLHFVRCTCSFSHWLMLMICYEIILQIFYDMILVSVRKFVLHWTAKNYQLQQFLFYFKNITPFHLFLHKGPFKTLLARFLFI